MTESLPTSNFISIRDIRIHYNLVVPNNKSCLENNGTIVLIHGFLCSTFTWHKCLQSLADTTGYDVLAYDRLGFGFTERILDGELYTRKNEELIALELFNKLNLSHNIHLISSSSGAVVAFDMAVARPDLIQSVIFVAPYGLVSSQYSVGPIGRFFLNTRPIQHLLKFGLTHFLPFKNSYYNEDIAKDEVTREGYLKPIRDDPLFLKSFVLFTQNYNPSSTDTQLDKLDNKLRILIITGEQDKIVPQKITEEFYSMLKKHRSSDSITENVVISQCGHLPQEEQAEKLVTIINQFINC